MPIQKVDTPVIVERVLREIWKQKTTTGGEVQGHLDRIFDFAIHKKYYHGENPASWKVLKHVLPSRGELHTTKHHNSLPYKDVGRFLQDLRAERDTRVGRNGGHTTAALALEFIVLSGVRAGEVTNVQWKDIDLKCMIWNVPPEKKKNKKIMRPVPITKPMLNVLEEAQVRRTDDSPEALVFQSQKAHASKMVVGTLRAIADRIGWDRLKLTTHGFRSTLRDWCRANRFPVEWWEIQVDHRLGDKTSQSYGHDPLIEERRGMMELWGEYCSKPAPEPKAGTVLKLSDKRRSA
jgi:integrase